MSRFNGSSSPLMLPNRRRQQQQQRPMTVEDQQTPNQYAQPKQQQPQQPPAAPMGLPNQPALSFNQRQAAAYQQAALRANMQRNVYANTLAQNNPATAGLPHVQAAIAARGVGNEMLANQAGLGPNYFQNREMVTSADQRANQMNTANVAGAYANTYRTEQMTPGMVENQRQVNTGLGLDNQAQSTANQFLPGQYEQANRGATLKNDAQATANQYMPNMTEAEIAQRQANTGKTQAETKSLGDETKYHKDRADKAETRIKQLEDMVAKLTPKTGGGPNPSGDLNGYAAATGQPGAGVTAGAAKATPGSYTTNPDGTKTYNGVTYQKGADGNWHPVSK